MFQPERDVRENNKQNLDLDKAQREEEKILKNILNTIDSVIKPSAIQNNTDISGLESNTNNKSNNIFTKIKNLILKLVSTLLPKSKDVNTIETNSEIQLTPIEVMSQNINNIKMYQEELDQRTKVLNNIPILQDAIKQYRDRVREPKAYNTKQTITDQLMQKRQRSHKGKNAQEHPR